MSDYIKREDALQRFTFEQGNRIPEVDVDNFPITITIKDIKRILRELAAADVAEVRRGYWSWCCECGINFSVWSYDYYETRLAWNTRAPILSAEEMEMLEEME